MKKKKMNFSHLLKNNLGVTLVEIVVAMGLMGIIGVGVANLSKVGGMQNKTFRQNNIVETAIGRINRVLSRADTCTALGDTITLAEVQALAAPVLEPSVTITNVQMIRVPNNPVADLGLGEGESGTVQIQLLVTFRKQDGAANRTVNRIAYARHIYENPNGAGITQFSRCANYESDSSRAAFEANCRTIGGTVRVLPPGVLVDPWVQQPPAPAPTIPPTVPATAKNYWCDFSTIDDDKYFTDKVRKEVCEALYGNVNSYNDAIGVKKCRDMLVAGAMTGANVDVNRIGLSNGAGGYNFRTSFDQNACRDLTVDNAFITGVNVNGSVECSTLDWCVQGTAGCGPWAGAGASTDHCTTDCSCARETQGDTSENDFGDHDGDGGVNTCRPSLSGDCSALRTEQGGGQYDEGAGTDYLTYTCYGLDCDFKDYFDFTLGDPATDNNYDSVLSVGLFETPDLQASTPTTTCGTPVVTASRTAGICAMFEPYVFTQVSNYGPANNSVPDSNGLNFAMLNDTSSPDPFISDGGLRIYGTAADLCNSGNGRCRSGGPGPSGEGVAASAGNCCSLDFHTQPGSGNQCGNPMQDDCGNVDLPGDPTQSLWSTQCTSGDYCGFNGSNASDDDPNDWTSADPGTNPVGCCQSQYSCGTDPASFPQCDTTTPLTTFDYCAPGTGSCSREHPSGECCLPSYSCAESPSAECLGAGGSVHNTCSGSTPLCLGTGPGASCVECNDTNNDGFSDGVSSCVAAEYCASDNTCQPDVCTGGSTDTDSQACTPPASDCDAANGETPVASSGSQERTRVCNASGNGYGSYTPFGACTGGTCACTASAPDASTIACGTTESNCAGTVNGSYCSAANTTCNAGSCDPVCTPPASSTISCGVVDNTCPSNPVTGTMCSSSFTPECNTSTGTCVECLDDNDCNVVSELCINNTCTCFIAGTKILMADGSEVDIEDVKVGDMLKGIKQNNKVLKLKRNQYRGKLYSINGSDYFVTEGHPFMTTEGWKSFNPKMAMEINPELKIGQLNVGDTLVSESGNVKVIKMSHILKSSPVYNFEVSGERVYYADGFLVHNK